VAVGKQRAGGTKEETRGEFYSCHCRKGVLQPLGKRTLKRQTKERLNNLKTVDRGGEGTYYLSGEWKIPWGTKRFLLRKRSLMNSSVETNN